MRPLLRFLRLAALALCVPAALALLGAPSPALARTDAALADVRLGDLPREARDIHRLILAGGPFRHERDGVVFGNRERLLPGKPRGYYREYTVPTPGAKNRGARRIVCGGAPTSPDTCYYTDDHYNSFRRIRE